MAEAYCSSCSSHLAGAGKAPSIEGLSCPPKRSILLCVPTFNPGKHWNRTLKAILSQTAENLKPFIIDSGSTDGTKEETLHAGVTLVGIPLENFDHGGTRQLAVDLNPSTDFIVFLTQDAWLASNESVERLLEAFNDIHVGAAYGRQLPRPGAKQIEAHARLFNYPDRSRTNSEKDIPSLGMKAAFLSNSFAAYRRTALADAGGFPLNTLVSEDMIVGARILKRGWKLAYQAEACVYHSHDYTLLQEIQRYFDIGALHSRESWLLKELGTPECEGLRFLLSEMKYLLWHGPWLIPSALLRTIVKYIGYRLGRMERYLPTRIKRRLSMQKMFWIRELD